jgi:hypothetical protein
MPAVLVGCVHLLLIKHATGQFDTKRCVPCQLRTLAQKEMETDADPGLTKLRDALVVQRIRLAPYADANRRLRDKSSE